VEGEIKMNTRLLMISSAVVMAVAGICLSFLPEELLNYAGVSTAKSPQLFLQILGALYLGFAMLNWMAKAQVMGGIYGRPIAMGNFMHFTIGALALIKCFFANTGMTMLLVPVIAYFVFSLLFGSVIFGKSPGK
jgi:hypothetical protein